MEPTTVKQEGADLQLIGLSSAVMGLIATIMTCTAILGRWGTYKWLDKGLALTLVLTLVIVPIGVVFREKTWAKRLEFMGKANLALGYSWLLMATLLFNRL